MRTCGLETIMFSDKLPDFLEGSCVPHNRIPRDNSTEIGNLAQHYFKPSVPLHCILRGIIFHIFPIISEPPYLE